MPQGTGKTNPGSEGRHIVDFSEVRAQKLEEKRRKTERIFFTHLLSVYSVTGDSTMVPVELVDVSEEGCSFQVPFDPQKPWPKELKEIPIRLYFSQDTYLEVNAKIQNSRPAIENQTRYLRMGCAVDKTTPTYDTYRQFVRFLRSYSENARKDMGDVTIFYL